jgi:hypothetical protein
VTALFEEAVVLDANPCKSMGPLKCTAMPEGPKKSWCYRPCRV